MGEAKQIHIENIKFVLKKIHRYYIDSIALIVAYLNTCSE